MVLVEVRDYALWPKHIHGDDALRDRLLAMRAGELVELTVDGVSGVWKKMSDGKDGRPTPGLKALHNARRHWHLLFRNEPGKLVSIHGLHGRSLGECRATTKTSEGQQEAKICPECRHEFQGNGWDGIDAHWRSRHEKIMPYEEAWPLLKDGTYVPQDEKLRP